MSCVYNRGFVGGTETSNVVKVYEYPAAHLYLGSFDLENQVVGLCFDDRVTDNVIGMDILVKFDMIQYINQPFLYLFDNAEDRRRFEKYDIITCEFWESREGYEAFQLFDTYIEYPVQCTNIDKATGHRYIEICNLRCYLKEQ